MVANEDKILTEKLEEYQNDLDKKESTLTYTKKDLTQTINEMRETEIARDILIVGQRDMRLANIGNTDEFSQAHTVQTTAQEIRNKETDKRSDDESRWISIDFVLHPHLYSKEGKTNALNIKMSVEYNVNIDATAIKNIIALPWQLNLAFPFFETEVDVQAHQLLFKYSPELFLSNPINNMKYIMAHERLHINEDLRDKKSKISCKDKCVDHNKDTADDMHLFFVETTKLKQQKRDNNRVKMMTTTVIDLEEEYTLLRRYN